MKAPGFPTQMGEEPGAFRIHIYRCRREAEKQGKDAG